MYKFIFYGMYKSFHKTYISRRGSQREQDVRISTVVSMSIFNITTFQTILFIIEKTFEIEIKFFSSIEFLFPIVFITIGLNHFFFKNNFNDIAKDYADIYDKYKYLDHIIGFGMPLVVFGTLALLVWLLGPL